MPSLVDALFHALRDGKPHSNFELVGDLWQKGKYRGPSIARLSARCYDLKKKYGVVINGKTDPHDSRKYWYTMVIPKKKV